MMTTTLRRSHSTCRPVCKLCCCVTDQMVSGDRRCGQQPCLLHTHVRVHTPCIGTRMRTSARCCNTHMYACTRACIRAWVDEKSHKCTHMALVCTQLLTRQNSFAFEAVGDWLAAPTSRQHSNLSPMHPCAHASTQPWIHFGILPTPPIPLPVPRHNPFGL